MSTNRYRVTCIVDPDGHADFAPIGSELEQRCKDREAHGFLDALCLGPDECPDCAALAAQRARGDWSSWPTTVMTLGILLCLFAGCGGSNGPDAGVEIEEVTTYVTPEGKSIELVFDRAFRSRIFLQVPFEDGWDQQNAELKLLKEEVVRLVSSEKPVQLRGSNTLFFFRKGRPIWGPHISFTGHGHYHRLLFAEEGRVENGVISAEGTNPRDVYYPYPNIPGLPR